MEYEPIAGASTNEIAKEIFTLDGVDHELVKKYQPKFLAKGGGQMVYEVPGHPNVVAKVATESLKKIIAWNLDHNEALDSLPEEIEELAKLFLEKEVRRHQQLKKYFGSIHVPNQKQYLIQVPVTPEILNKIYDNNPPVGVEKSWSVMTIQKHVDELANPSKLALVGGYAEK